MAAHDETSPLKGGERRISRRVVAIGICGLAGVCMVSCGLSSSTGAGTKGELLALGGRGIEELVPVPDALMLARRMSLAKAWNIDQEIQGDCKCERPFNKVTRVINKEIVCHCPYYMVPSPPPFPDQPPPPTELKYADGCKCVKGKGTFNKETICTCPIIQTEEYDFDSYPSSYKPAAGKGV